MDEKQHDEQYNQRLADARALLQMFHNPIDGCSNPVATLLMFLQSQRQLPNQDTVAVAARVENNIVNSVVSSLTVGDVDAIREMINSRPRCTYQLVKGPRKGTACNVLIKQGTKCTEHAKR